MHGCECFSVCVGDVFGRVCVCLGCVWEYMLGMYAYVLGMCVGVWQSEGMKGVIIHVCKSSPGAKVRVIARIYAKLRRDYA